MKFVSIDIETTGLNPARDQVLEIAAVVEDTDNVNGSVEALPAFEATIQHERITGSPFALMLNADLISKIAKRRASHVDLNTAIRDLVSFIEGATGIPAGPKSWTAAGKNLASFDFRFLPKTFTDLFHHRIIDAGSVFMGANPTAWDRLDTLPSLGDITGEVVSHTALDDARDVVRALRTLRGV